VSRVVVDLERLAELADRMERFQAHLTRADNEVDARVQALHATWIGGAAGAHANYSSAALANRRMWAG
jgi:hypothetical protein